MADTTFVPQVTPIDSTWLNEVNDHVHHDTPISPSTTVHDASKIANTPQGTIAATTVQGAINEIVSDLSASSGSSLVGFIQSGTGAVARTIQAKDRESISDTDYTTIDNAIASAGTNEEVKVVGTPTYTSTTNWNGRQHQTDEAPFLLDSFTWIAANLNSRMCTNNGILFVAEYVNSSVAIFSLSNPRKPTYLTHFAVDTQPRHVDVVGKYLFVACYGAAKIQVYDIGALTSPSLVGTITTGAGPKMFQIVGNYIFVACYGTAKIEKHRYILPTSGITGFESIKIAETIALSCNPLCLSYNGLGMLAACGLTSQKVSLIGTTTMNVISETNIGTANHGTCSWATETQLLLTDAGNNLLYSCDCSSLAPVTTGTAATSTAPEQIEIVGNRCYVPSLTASGTQAYLDCFDITDAASPVKFKSVPLTVTGAGFTAYYDGCVYVNGHFPPYNIDVIEVKNDPSGRPEIQIVEKACIQDLSVSNLNLAIQSNTWTPILADSAGNNFTLSFAVGTYFKIANLVVATCECVWTATGSAGATQLQVTNLPFTTQALSGSRYAATIGNLKGIDTTAGNVMIVAGADNNSTSVGFRQIVDNAAPTALPANGCSAAGELSFTIVYIATA